MPLPPSDNAQEVTDRHLETFPVEVTPTIHTETIYQNSFAYFEFPNPQGAQIIRHTFRAKVPELRWDLDLQKVQAVTAWPEAFLPYLEQHATLSQNTKFQRVLQQIVPQPGNPARDLTAVMAWVGEHMTYDHSQASLRADAAHAFRQQRGHCSDYHGLCATMGRALGQPARVTYGLNLFPKSSPSHCKLELFLAPYGWVSFDVSETQKLLAKIEQSSETPERKNSLKKAALRRFTSGFRDNAWLLVTRGTNYDLAPKASQKVPVVRTIYAEADGAALPEPDPANPHERTFAWMTAHRFTPNKKPRQAFQDFTTLSEWEVQPSSTPNRAKELP